MILYYAILILYYYYSTNIQEQIIPQKLFMKIFKVHGWNFLEKSYTGIHTVKVIDWYLKGRVSPEKVTKVCLFVTFSWIIPKSWVEKSYLSGRRNASSVVISVPSATNFQLRLTYLPVLWLNHLRFLINNRQLRPRIG